jgi:ribonuclease HI
VKKGEPSENDAQAFWWTIETDKMIHVVTNGGANQNPARLARRGPILRHNSAFTVMWKQVDHAGTDTMELRAVAEALLYLPAGMTGWITTDLRMFVRESWNRCPSGSGTVGEIRRSRLWCGLVSAITRHSRVEFSREKA